MKDDDRELAEVIWTASNGTVNLRYTYGHWLLVQKYEFVEDGSTENLVLTASGRDFLESPEEDTEVALGEAEGLVKLLSIVADNGTARTGGLLEDWSEYLKRRSPFGMDLTFNTPAATAAEQPPGTCESELFERRSNMYFVTQPSLEYLKSVGNEDSVGGGDHPEIWTLMRQRESTIMESLRELLRDMDPFAFEPLLKRLLEETDYQNVKVTSPSGGGGVDVVADIELGITLVREVVQVKRHGRAIQRKDLDVLRCSLYRFNAVMGRDHRDIPLRQGHDRCGLRDGCRPHHAHR